MMRAVLRFSALALLLSACDSGPPPIPPLPDSGPRDAAVGDAGPGPMMCDDRMFNGDETAIDCGGSCPPCADGDSCRVAEDCESNVCMRAHCLVPSCMDGVRNGRETGADCGGDCGLCPGGESCTTNEQCLSGRCRGGVCAMSDCEDGRMNGDETAVDCGGPLCRACAGGLACEESEDCESLICASNVCADAACNDRVQNQDETSVDCGGGFCPACRDGLACNIDTDCEGRRCLDGGCISCADGVQNAEETDVDCGGGLCDPCADLMMCVLASDCRGESCNGGVCESCSDGVQNQDETDVDCGGALCAGCADGLMCTIGTDCASADCLDNICASCSDRMMNRDETDVDCGGTLCAPCADRLMCLSGTDCASSTCLDSLCVSCADGVMNQDETDRDCGGSVCPGCGPSLMCDGDSDCLSNICDGPTGLCNAPGCGDMVMNGEETDLDCGGSMCIGCAVDDVCVLPRDCLSGVCTAGACVAPTCADGVANGDETDIDCGGSSTCDRCPDGRLCPNGVSDCMTGICTSGRCGMNRGHLILIGHDYFSVEPNADRILGNAVMMAAEVGTIDVLVYDEFADVSSGGEVAHTETAITNTATAAGRTVRFTRLSNSANLASSLVPPVDVLLLPEQERGSSTLSTIATAWNSDLQAFLRTGGVIITTNFVDQGWRLVNGPGLATITGTRSISGNVTLAAGMTTHPLAASVTSPYPARSGSCSYQGLAAGGETVFVTGADPVVHHITY